jgi:hypothetical protein
MSFVYPRTITVKRPTPSLAVGHQPYGGLSVTNEDTIATGLPASIQQQRAQGLPEAGLPNDPVRGNVAFYILIPRKAAAKGTINDHDIVVDELGNRYQVASNYWNSLGYRLFANILEA